MIERNTKKTQANRRVHKRTFIFSAKMLSAIFVAIFVLAGTFSNATSASTVPVSLWTNATTPTNTSALDSNAVEVGVKIKPTEDGYITGIKFYKGTGNGGTHTGSLWSSSGTLLASAQFTSETSTGWQEVYFSTPVAVTANTQYTASYFAPQGHYAYDYNYFGSQYTQGPLTAPASGAVSGNGVYYYTSTSAFPGDSYMDTNYWVDVIFSRGSETTVTHGSQINQTNTGYRAWQGPQGQTCTDKQLTIYETEVDASDLGSTVTCAWFKGGINIDANITLNACRVDVPINTYPQFNHVNLNYCTINPTTPADWSLGAGNFSATRCQILGSSDGVRYAGTTNDALIENYIRTTAQSFDDHNDGVQAYGAEGGGTILRNNIDGNPVSGGYGNAAIFIADGAEGTFEIRDNYLIGGGYNTRLHESAYYRVTGNIIEKDSYLYDPLNTAYSIPGAFLEFSGNKLSDNTAVSL